MKKKHSELLKYLSLQDKSFTSNELANALAISVRSVKNYVYEINSLYNKKIILSSRNGYKINRQLSTSLLITQDNELIPQTGEQRAFYIIKRLILEHTSHLDLFDLCDYMCISYSTIKSVIAKMNKSFSSYHVKFICEKDCVHIIGDEKNKRKLISYVINEESKTSFIDAKQLKECFTTIDIDVLISIVTSTFKKHNYYLNDFANVNLLLHLVIIIDREVNGNCLESGEANFKIDNEQERNLVNDLCDRLENEFQIHLNRYEQFEIYILFKANANFSLPTTKEELEKTIGSEIVQLVEYYVKKINSLYMIDLSNESFTTPFSLHLKNLLFRARAGRYTSNPMAEAIKLNSPIVFDIAIYIGLDLIERYDITINEDETAFLAIHIGSEIERQNVNKSKIPSILLCPDYRDMSSNLLNTLLLNFGNQINIIRSVHSEEELRKLIKELGSFDFMMIFTTIPLLQTENDFTVVNITPFNLENQYGMILDTILRNQGMYKNQKLRTNFHTFFEEDLFIADSPIHSKNKILNFLCDKLQEKNYVDPEFEKNVYRRENAATTAFGNIAIPHSMDMDAIKTSIAVAISKKGLQWGTNTVHLVLLLAINKADKKTFRELYESLISIFSEESIIQEIRNCSCFKDFETLIYHHIDTTV